MSTKQSDSFTQNRFFWTIFGLWPGKIPNKYYKYFSFTYLMIIFVAYEALLTLNLFYTPLRIDSLIREIIFFFTEIATGTKACMVIFKREKISVLFDMLDCEEFKGSDATGREIVRKYHQYYKSYLKTFTILCNFTYFAQVLFPVFGYWIFGNNLELPICKYYFLSDETRNQYFTLIYIYESYGMYNHMMYNVNNDSLIAGYMALAIGQVKVLQHDLENLKVDKSDDGSEKMRDLKQQQKLRKILHHYGLLIEYVNQFQNVIGGAMFVQFGIGSAIICASMLTLLLPATVESYMFTVAYFMALNLEVFTPAWLGTQLTYESHDLMTAAYSGEWLPRSERYKRSLKLFVERAKQPIIITGLELFPLSLPTYISIMKTAYSCFALIRIFHNRQE
ncbi:odorant receptor 7a-like isoform X1 [Cydia fagiglandana]|uniref:odorant receptor 7a-like isoform X1 n=1 Tax=Cydia fagiglandana TaxID=1458189 RepID=UPI002FEE1AB3